MPKIMRIYCTDCIELFLPEDDTCYFTVQNVTNHAPAILNNGMPKSVLIENK